MERKQKKTTYLYRYDTLFKNIFLLSKISWRSTELWNIFNRALLYLYWWPQCQDLWVVFHKLSLTAHCQGSKRHLLQKDPEICRK
jgi:hypothetical protein